MLFNIFHSPKQLITYIISYYTLLLHRWFEWKSNRLCNTVDIIKKKLICSLETNNSFGLSALNYILLLTMSDYDPTFVIFYWSFIDESTNLKKQKLGVKCIRSTSWFISNFNILNSLVTKRNCLTTVRPNMSIYRMLSIFIHLHNVSLLFRILVMSVKNADSIISNL